MCVCWCVFVYLPACIMHWSCDNVIFDCLPLIMRKAVRWSESQNRHSHRCKPGGKSKSHTPADLLWPKRHRWVSLLPPSTSLLAFFPSLPINVSEFPFTLPFIFDHHGWKSKCRRPLRLEFCICASLIGGFCSKCFRHKCVGSSLYYTSSQSWKKLSDCCGQACAKHCSSSSCWHF